MKKENKNMKISNRKNIRFMAAAALSAALLAGQVQPAVVRGEDSAISVSSLIPDNITIDSPVSLSEISLPGSKYGTLSWVDSSSVPSERVQSYEVVFRPSSSVDLSRISGWDGESDAIYGTVTVVVSSLDSYNEEESEDSRENQETEDSEETEYEQEPEYTEETEDSEDTDNVADTEETEDSEEAEAPEENGGSESGEDTEETEKADESEASGEDKESDAGEEPKVTKAPEEDETSQEAQDPEATKAPEEKEDQKETEVPEKETAPEVTKVPEKEEKDNIFDRPKEKDERPATAEEGLTKEEQQQRAEENHSCNGIYVSGINLPWYVQFRATNGDNYEFTNEGEANIFKSYEFELWDLQNNTEYHIPDGEYISVTVPVKAGYEYTIEHLLDNGAMETIIPSVDGSTMVFSTHSFSPFGIAGSKPLVGGDITEDGYQNAVTPTVTQAAATTTPSSSTGSSSGSGSSVSAGSSAGSSTSSGNEQQSSTSDSDSQDQSSSSDAVNTGDTTNIYPFVILVAAAVIIIGVVVYLKKRK